MFLLIEVRSMQPKHSKYLHPEFTDDEVEVMMQYFGVDTYEGLLKLLALLDRKSD